MPGEIVIFFTGGTIGMRPEAEDRGLAPAEDLSKLIKDLDFHLADIKLRAVHFGNRPSPHMTPELMFDLGRRIDQVLAEPEVLGAVVLHGTDVLIESAFMADIMISSTKPVVFTGSMRYYGELGYDGLRNLLGGLKACLLPLPPEIGVVLLMADRFFTAREVAKINSLNIDAFAAPEAGPVGYVAGDTILLTRMGLLTPTGRRTIVHPEKLETAVPLITCYTGMDEDVIHWLRGNGAAGLVLEGFGAGNAPPGIVPAVAEMVQEDIPVVLTTRCQEGGTWPLYAYPGGGADLVKRGVIQGGRLSGPKARILLMLALGQTRDMAEIRNIFSGY